MPVNGKQSTVPTEVCDIHESAHDPKHGDPIHICFRCAQILTNAYGNGERVREELIHEYRALVRDAAG